MFVKIKILTFFKQCKTTKHWVWIASSQSMETYCTYPQALGFPSCTTRSEQNPEYAITVIHSSNQTTSMNPDISNLVLSMHPKIKTFFKSRFQ